MLPQAPRSALIGNQDVDGPYLLEILARDPTTLAQRDSLLLPQPTAAYLAAEFEGAQPPAAPIALTGEVFDAGIDFDGNGRFDELVVSLGVELTRADYYRWSARLEDGDGTEIGFDGRAASLPAGTTSITLYFDGLTIGNNHVDGPYRVRSLLIYGLRGQSLLALDAGETSAYRASQFEGANAPPVANAGPDESVEATSAAGAWVTLDGSGSFDPDGDVLTFDWTGPFGLTSGPVVTVLLPIGTSAVTLTVDDGRGETATDTVVVTVADTTPPAVTAALVPVTRPVGYKQGFFMVQYTCVDTVDASPAAEATLDGHPVARDQVLFLLLSEEERAFWEQGVLRMLKATSFELKVTCTDAAGNAGVATAAPDFRPK